MLRSRAYLLLYASGILTTGVTGYAYIKSRQTQLAAEFQQHSQHLSSLNQARAREQHGRIGDLIATLKYESIGQKLERVYDGATRTHAIGFSNDKKGDHSS